MAFIYGDTTNCKVRNGQTRKEYECHLGYQVNSQDIATNTSNVTLRLEVRSINSTYQTTGTGQTTIIDGTTVASNQHFSMKNTNEWQVFGEKTITIYHNADGTCSISKSGSFTSTAGSSDYSLRSGSASVTVVPATIPRTSSIKSITGNMLGSNVTINIDSKSDSFVHGVYYTRFDGAVYTVGSSVGTSCTFTPALGDASYIPNSTSGTAIITVDTYSGSTKVGSVSQAITLYVPDSVVPSISSVSVSAGNSVIPSSWGVYVQGKSQLKVVTNASGSYGSYITSYKITGIDSLTYNSANFTSGVLQLTGTRTITATVTDSRGRTASATTNYTCVAYSNPSITVAAVTRCNADGTENEEGEYVKYKFNASVSAVNNKNGSNFKLGYKQNNANEYTYIDIASGTFSIGKEDIISGVTFSVDNSYDFQFYVADYFTASSVGRQLGTGFTLMDFRYSGKGMAIGKVSEKDALEVNMDIYDKNGGLITSNNYYTYNNDNKFDDVTEILGNKFEGGKVYIITNAPVNDGNYIQGGCTHTVIGMETPGQQYGYQMSLTYGNILFRIKSYGTWSSWQPVRYKETITTGVEFKTGKIIDGKEEYGKKIDCGYLPAAKSPTYTPHGLTNFTLTRPPEGYAFSSSYNTYIPLPFVERDEVAGYNVTITVDSGNIVMDSDKGQSHYHGYVTLYYTKK